MKLSKSLAAIVLICVGAGVALFMWSRRTQEHCEWKILRGLCDIRVGVQGRREALGFSGKWLPLAAAREGDSDSWRYAILWCIEHVPEGFSEKRWRESEYAECPHPTYCFTNHKNRAGDYTTNCLAVVGNGTLAESDSRVFEKDAILVLAVGDTEIGWGEPGDLQVDEQGNLISRWPGPIYGRIGVVFGDGGVWLLDASVPLDKLALFFTVDSARAHDADEVLGPYKVYGEPFGED